MIDHHSERGGGRRAGTAESTCVSGDQAPWTVSDQDATGTETGTIAATGSGPVRFEQTIADAGFLRRSSDRHVLVHHHDRHDHDAAGATTPEGRSPC